jgi:hypothetical protein
MDRHKPDVTSVFNRPTRSCFFPRIVASPPGFLSNGASPTTVRPLVFVRAREWTVLAPPSLLESVLTPTTGSTFDSRNGAADDTTSSGTCSTRTLREWSKMTDVRSASSLAAVRVFDASAELSAPQLVGMHVH